MKNSYKETYGELGLYLERTRFSESKAIEQRKGVARTPLFNRSRNSINKSMINATRYPMENNDLQETDGDLVVQDIPTEMTRPQTQENVRDYDQG